MVVRPCLLSRLMVDVAVAHPLPATCKKLLVENIPSWYWQEVLASSAWELIDPPD